MRILLVNPEVPNTFWSMKIALKFVSKKAILPPLDIWVSLSQDVKKYLPSNERNCRQLNERIRRY
jgi:hypothetical protein